MIVHPDPSASRHRTPWGFVTALVWLACACAAVAGARPPNVILILADDMGYECLGAYGGTSYRTPHLDRMAREGVRFEYAFAQPLCTPTRVQLMTGQYNHRNYNKWGALPPNSPTFGHMLQAAGYATACIGKWQLSGEGVTPRTAGFSESLMWAYGFDLERIGFQLKLPKGSPGNYYYNPSNPRERYEVIPDDRPHMTSRYWRACIVQNETTFVPTTANDYGPDINVEFALRFIERHRETPFFVYYPMILTHGPNEPAPGTPGVAAMSMSEKLKAKKQNFRPMVEHTDQLVGRILAKLDELGLGENTLVMFTGDNGTSAGIETQTGHGSIQGGKGATADAGTRVPLLVQWKGRAAAGTVCKDLVDTTDFMATIAEASGAKLPAGPGITLDGRSFLPQVLGKKGAPREWVFFHYDKNPEKADFNPKFPRARFVRGKEYKLYDNGRLYDVARDPPEQTMIPPGSEKGAARAARQALQKVLDSMQVKPDFYTQGGVTRENNLAAVAGRRATKDDDDL